MKYQNQNLKSYAKKYDAPVEEILRATVQQKAEMVNIFQTSKEIKVELGLKRGKKKSLMKYSVSRYRGLIDRIKYMANLPLQQIRTKQRSMIQVYLFLPQGKKKIMAFYVEAKDG